MSLTWKQALGEGAVTGSLASLLSTGYLLWAGRRHGETAAPLNAVSHWCFGDPALREDRPRAHYTVAGLLIHHGASVFWGVLHAKAWGDRQDLRHPMRAAAGAIAASGVACLVDYRLTPKRLTPGFEHRLSSREMAHVYAWFAVGLAVGSVALRERREKARRSPLPPDPGPAHRPGPN